VYGDGPFAQPAGEIAVPYRTDDRAKLELGQLSVAGGGGVVVPPAGDRDRDLPRVNRVAQIGDARNDENLVVAQLHVAFLRFHNNAVDWVRDNEPERTGVGAVFSRARDLTRWIYHWLCVHAYLATVLEDGAVDRAGERGRPAGAGRPDATVHAAGVLGGRLPVRPQHDPRRLRLEPQLRCPREFPAEIRTGGDALGPVGSRIVAETIIGQLRRDPRSYLNQTGWTPAAVVRLPDDAMITSIAAFLQFAGVL
jgi:hypothetical protein